MNIDKQPALVENFGRYKVESNGALVGVLLEDGTLLATLNSFMGYEISNPDDPFMNPPVDVAVGTLADNPHFWQKFKDSMQRHHGVMINDHHKPGESHICIAPNGDDC